MDDQERNKLFSPAELKLFRYTAVLSCAVVTASLVGFIVWILGRLTSHFYNLLLPLSVAGVMALMLYPAVDLLKRRVGMSHMAAVCTLMTGFTIALGVLITLVLPSAVAQTSALLRSLPEIAEGIRDNLSSTFPALWNEILSRIESWKPEVDPEPGDPTVTDRIKSYMGLLAGLTAVPFFLFFALMSGRHLRDFPKELLAMFRADTQKEIMYLVEMFVGYVTTFFQGQAIIAVIMGCLMAIGFTLIDLRGAVAAGLLLGLLNIVPYLGTIVGLLVVLPLAYLQPGAGIELVVLALVVFVVVQFIESWFLTPKIMADRSGLHPAVVVISIFFWGIALDGVIGMILAVPLTAFVVALWRHMRMRLAQQLVSDEIELPPGPVQTGEPQDEQADRMA